MTKELQEHYKDNLFWIVWVCQYDPFGRVMSTTVLPYHYKHKSSAVRRAKQLYGVDNPRYEWVVKPVYFFPMGTKLIFDDIKEKTEDLRNEDTTES